MIKIQIYMEDFEASISSVLQKTSIADVRMNSAIDAVIRRVNAVQRSSVLDDRNHIDEIIENVVQREIGSRNNRRKRTFVEFDMNNGNDLHRTNNTVQKKSRHDDMDFELENEDTRFGRLNFDTTLYSVGDSNIACVGCGGKHFSGEVSSNASANKHKGFFYDCCSFGDLANLDETISDYPMKMQELFDPGHKFHKNFLTNIRKINSNYACASLQSVKRTGNNDEVSGRVHFSNGPDIYKIQGVLYHRQNIIAVPNMNEFPTNGQLFFVDTEEAYKERIKQLNFEKPNRSGQINTELIAIIDEVINECYPYAKAYKMMKEIIAEEEKFSLENGTVLKDVKLLFSLKKEYEKEKHRYNVPVSNEVCAVVVTDCDGNIPPAYVVIHHRGDKSLIVLPHFNKDVEPMSYPMFNVYGNPGWHTELKSISGKKITQNQYFRYRLFEMDNTKFIPHFYAGKLFQQWLVDSYVKVECERLQFIRNKQVELKAFKYSALKKFIESKAENSHAKIGRTVILPTSYSGGPRNREQAYLDAMAIVAETNRPHLFVTITCNPNDEDIARALKPGQLASDNPVIVVRVFRLKLREFCQDIIKRNYFGRVIGYTYSVEFQKRDLPHAHILIILAKNYYSTPNEINQIICAQLPSEFENPLLYHRVRTLMLHGPCQRETNKGVKYGVCWDYEHNKCSKKFPKEFREFTEMNENGYPFYARPDDGRIAKKNPNDVALDNRYVIPYNADFLLKYNCHINVELVASIDAVKYIYKYIFKGYDKALVMFVTEDNEKVILYDEIDSHLNARYVGPMEGAWRLLNYELHEHSHSIEKLPIHLENEQDVFCNIENDDGMDFDEVEDLLNKETKLIAYFKYNEMHHTEKDFVPYTYKEFPKYFRWINKQSVWQKRKNFGKKLGVIGRLHMVDPRYVELYHLRILAYNVKGAKSFVDMRNYDGKIYSSYKEACLARGLIRNDTECYDCIREASIFKFPKALRDLFVTVLLYCNPLKPELLWDEFKNELTYDYRQIFIDDDMRNKKGLIELEKLLYQHGKSLNDFPTMPQLDFSVDFFDEAEVYDFEVEFETFNSYYKQMNEEQKKVVDFVIHTLNDVEGVHSPVFIDGPGGTGKTFVFMALYHYCRAKLKKIENMAFSGIAATMLKKGCTVHTAFKLPLNLNRYSRSNIEKNSTEGNFHKNTNLIIWDELPMAPKHALNAVDLKLREIMNQELPFGNKAVVAGGDFRQLLPVVEGATDNEIIDSTVKSSPLWKEFKVFHLTENMRVGKNEKHFASWLLNLGDGKLNDSCDMITLPEDCKITTDSLVDAIYGKLIKEKKYSEFRNCCICAFYNSDVDEINSEVLKLIPGEPKSYLAFNSADKNILASYPEILSSIETSGLPPNELILKENCVVMLLRNINLKKGMVNGTRIQITAMGKNVLKGIVLTGDKAGDVIFIPRITLNEEKHTPFPLSRHQFPVKLAMGLSVHKTQSQTIKNLGIDLRRRSFAYGHVYTAFSRATSWKDIIVRLLPDSDRKIYNKVLKDILS